MHPQTKFDLFALIAASLASMLAFAAWRRMTALDRNESDPESVAGRGLLRLLVSPIASRMRPTTQAELDELRMVLMHAGRRSRDAVDRFLEERVLVLLGGLGFALVCVSVIGGGGGFALSYFGLIGGVLGPKWMLRARTSERRDSIATTLPTAVDLLTTCVEAGLSLEKALARVSGDLERAAPVLTDELNLTSRELAAGVSLPDSLRRLSRRVGLDDLSALCGVLAQAHGLGAPVGVTLREFAESSRRQRMSQLEERAGKVAAKLTIPLAIFFLPSAMLVILGPAIVGLARAFQ